ncbi:amino acid adenylation domain-containing protein [Streptomyces silvisoli]|uniref:Amino acid adenylation domain-containing protein n=1 Tax=Streptomyces silvisoli TaxID=3034235 RepID=A0ABT5ZS70_9ACTN|nr:amino acid adenylation domain-containing protein [Streptomyces silvisoli]MDF3292670.1 amino acid adenylation domain-containing protein [Streptomyces silvisoli]
MVEEFGVDARRLVPALGALPISTAEAQLAVASSLRRERPVDVSRTVVGHVAHWAQHTPDAVAVTDRSGSATYRELERRVAAVRDVLTTMECRPGAVIAAAGPRGAESVVLLLALESMALTYLPVDAAWPHDRLARVLRQSRACHLVSYHRDAKSDGLAAAADAVGVPVLDLPNPAELPTGDHPVDLRGRCEDPGEPRYVYYTSGTTGVPKGALVDHQGMINHLWAKVLDLGLGPADRVGLTAPLTFDIAIWQMLAPLLVGGRIVALNEGETAFPRPLVRYLQERDVTVVELVPTVLEWLANEAEDRPDRNLSRLRCLVSTGEELTPQLAGRLLARFPGAMVVNAYGFTETSDDVTHHVVVKDDLSDARLPVGSPVINTVLYVLVADGDGWRAARPGENGELFVGGLPPGCGYLDDERATRSAFFRDTLDPASPSGRLYRSGDVVTVADGLLRYVGRLDRQVKVSGVRMELGEIEAALRRHDAIVDCAVIAVDTADGDGRQLVGHVVPRQGGAPAAAELLSFLRTQLPSALVPRRWHTHSALPVTANGKTDFRALATLSAAGADSEDAL